MEGVPPEKITFIPNAIEVGRFNGISTEKAKKSIGLAGKFPVIGVVGNFRPVKGLVSFIEAAAEVYREIPTARFVLVGKGLQEEELRGRARDLGIQERVLFLKDYSDIPAVMAAFDVAVQPSLSESFSNALLEYMASSKPIVATRVGDTEIVIEDGREGLLVKPNGPEELSAAILSLCKNRGKADEMGKLARVKVETNWSLSKILDTYEQFYKNLVLKNK
jgi:glycosyltransferase involved in cell wall biosynthesis